MTPSPNTPEAAHEATPRRPLSPRALEANRQNAQRSTGPRTEEGKATSRLNAGRHHITAQVLILPPEEHAAAEKFCQPIAASLHPEGPEEIQLARAVAENYWRLNQARAAVANRFARTAANTTPEAMAGGHPQIEYALHVANTFARDADFLRLITLYEQRIFNQLQKEKRELEAMQKARLEKRQAALSESRPLYRMAAAAGQPWDPESEAKANGGFVFSAPLIEDVIGRSDRLKHARRAEFELLNGIDTRSARPRAA